MHPFPTLKNPLVRDLLWSCFGPNLIDSFQEITADQSINACHLTLTTKRRQWLVELDNAPAPLLNFLSTSTSRRLGHYYEKLWQFFIDCDPDLELIGHNIAVHQPHRTLGEFDVIYLDRVSGCFYHLELAVKYYLQTTLENRLSSWHGPNCEDRFDIKFDRLIHHQIMLSNHEHAKTTLQALGVSKLKKEIALKGTLFYHPEYLANKTVQSRRQLTSSETTIALSKQHNRGQWFRLSHFCQHVHSNTSWSILPRKRWLSPFFDNSSQSELFSNEELIKYFEHYFSTQTQPIMICAVEFQHGYYCESNRIFVTPDSWMA